MLYKMLKIVINYYQSHQKTRNLYDVNTGIYMLLTEIASAFTSSLSHLNYLCTHEYLNVICNWSIKQNT